MLLHRLSRWGCSIIAVGLMAACASNASAAHIPGMSQLGGWVYIDRNNDGHLAFLGEPNPEFVIGGVTITLHSDTGLSPDQTTVTDPYGRYLFPNILPDKYDLIESDPNSMPLVQYVDGKDTLGSLIQLGNTPITGADSAGTVQIKPTVPPWLTYGGAFRQIVLTADIGGEFYNFGERGLALGYASKTDLFASAPSSNTAVPEPTSTFLALSAVLSGWLIPSRRNRG